MTPVVPFDPARAVTASTRVSLRDAYSEDTIRSFVDNLRALAVLRPDSCQELFGAMDHMLTALLREIRSGGTRIAYGLGMAVKLNDLSPDQAAAIEKIIDELNGEKGGA
jgi:hypothetical protein